MEKEKREEPNETREELPSGKKGSINRCGNVKYEDTWVEPKRGHQYFREDMLEGESARFSLINHP